MLNRLRLRALVPTLEFWKWLHRWMGLTLGLLLVLISLTGSYVVYLREFDAALNPQFSTPRAEGASLPADAIIAAAQTYAAESLAGASVRLVQPPDPVWPVWIARTTGTHRPFDHDIFIDPASGAVLGHRVYGSSLSMIMYRLHHDLMISHLGGHEIVGVSGIMLVVASLTGIYLWWPKPGRFWRSITWRRGAPPQRMLLDLHNVSAMWLLVPMLVAGVTGITLSFHDLTDALFGAEEPPANSVPVNRQVAAPLGSYPVTAEQAIALVRDRWPETQLHAVFLPAEPALSWRVAMRHEPEWIGLASRGAVQVDARSGAMIGPDPFTRERTAAQWYLEEQRALHFGALFGPVGKALMFVAGLMPPALFITGFLLWNRKRKSRKLARPVRRNPVDATVENGVVTNVRS